MSKDYDNILNSIPREFPIRQIKAIYGTDNPREILVILTDAEGPLSDIESTLNDLDKRIKAADSKFKGYLQHKDRNIKH